jgi:hypothetical protein
MTTIRDKLWIWSHKAGGHNDKYNLPGSSRMTPAEAAAYLGLPNLLMVVLGNEPTPPFDRDAAAMQSLRRVVWSIVGDSSSRRNDQKTDLDEVTSLAARFPNISGGIMDDFFKEGEPGEPVSRYGVADLAHFRSALHAAVRPLDLWVVIYAHQLHLPVAPHLAETDVVTFWTWKAAHLADLEKNFAALEKLAPSPRKVLGCYMWDYGDGKPMPLDQMQHQCRFGLRWLEEGRIDGIILLASCICDLSIASVEWTRKWIREIGDTPLR